MSLLKGVYNSAGEFLTFDQKKIMLAIKVQRQKVVSHGKLAEATITRIKKAQEYLKTERASNTNESSQNCLNTKISEQEIKVDLLKLKDFGPGIDGIPPISVVGHVDHMGAPYLKRWNLNLIKSLMGRRYLWSGPGIDYFYYTKGRSCTLDVVTCIEESFQPLC